MWIAPSCRKVPSRLLWKFRETWWERCRTFMLWLTSTAWGSRRVRRRIFPVFLAVAVFAVAVCVAQEVHVPASAIAGEEATISTTGSGGATFYLIGPGTSKKTDINLGKEIHLTAQDLRNAGNYL